MRIGSGAEELILEKLDAQAALATLAKLAESSPPLAKSSEAERLVLYRETGGKPLLLRWTAGQVGRGSCLTLADAIAYLRSCPEGNDPLEFIFGDLVEDFDDDEARVLCALTYFTLPAKVEHIAEVSGCSPAAADRALRSLSNRSLVVPSEELTTFVLVPLVADFLRKKKPDVVAETGDRLEQRAYALVVENGYQKHDRFPVLDAYWLTVAAALPRFVLGANDRFQTICNGLDDFLDFTGRWDEQLALSKDAESRAVEAGNLEQAAGRAYDVGWVLYTRGQLAEALAYAARAETYFREAGTGIAELSAAMQLRGMAHSQQQDHPAAIAVLREVVELTRTLGRESFELVSALNALASAESRALDHEAAESDYRQALRVARSVDNPEAISLTLGNLAAQALRREDWLDAEVLCREALPLAEAIGRRELIAAHNHRLAMALVRQDRKAEAQTHARRGVELFTQLRLPALASARETLAECEE
jgi:tetratricopeptide (TPR) repeat protein